MIGENQRYEDVQEAMRVILSAFQSKVWTALPGIVKGYDATKQTCTVQPTIMGTVKDENGVPSYVNLPLLLDCPVHFPHGGGFTLTFPVAVGDECLVVFASRCIDGWWQSGGMQREVELRMHDLSDGFAFVGFNSYPNRLSAVSTNSVVLRSDNNATKVELTQAGVCNITAPTAVNITTSGACNVAAATCAINAGAIDLTGVVGIVGTLTVNGVPMGELHTHSNVQTGGGISGPVVP